METRASRISWSIDNDGTWLHMLVQNGKDARAYAESHKGKPLRVTFKEWREKRTLSANAYAWTLLGKLSGVLGIPPKKIYRELIRDVGDNYTTVRVQATAAATLRRQWEANGLGWITEIIGASGPGCVDVALYAGSSSYNTKQMARLIDLIIEECRENNIEYLPPDKLATMLEVWDAKDN